MALSANQSAWLSLSLGIGAFLVDRGQKFYQINIEGWRGGEVVHVTSFFNYILVWNRGISYGFLTGLPQYIILMLVAAALAMLAIWWYRAETFVVRGAGSCHWRGLVQRAGSIFMGRGSGFFSFLYKWLVILYL